MSSIVVAGDTSGTCTLQAPAVAGSTVLTLPAVSGTVITTAAGQTLASPTFTGTTTAADLAYTGTLTGSTGILNIGSGQVYKDASGNVGLGTSVTSGYLLNLGNGNAANAGININNDYAVSGQSKWMLRFSRSDNSYTAGIKQIPYVDGGGISLWAGTSAGAEAERMRIDSSGNVLVGTSVNSVYDGVAQPRPLVVQSASTATGQYNSTNALVICNSDTTTNNASQLNFAAITGASTNQYTSAVISCIYGARTNTIYPSGTLTFATAPATQAPLERMRIDSSGSVLINCTSSPTGNAIGKGSIAALIESGDAFNLKHTANGNTMFNLWQTGTASYAPLNFFKGSTQTQVGSIACTTSATAYNTTSDQRLKENIVDAPSALASVNAIKVRSFDFISDNSHVDYGYIAQELLEVAPEAVHVPSNKDEMMGVDLGRLTPRLVKAIQEQQTLIEALTARLTALEGVS